MSKKRLTVLTLLLTLSIALLAACGGKQAPAAPAATPAPVEESADSGSASGESGGAAAPVTLEGTGETLSGVHTYVLVPGQSTASYIVNEEFLARALDKLGIPAGKKVVTGSTTDVEGSITVDLDNSTVSDSSITVNLATLATDQERRDKWVREKDPQFGKFSTATFVPTAIQNPPDAYVDGEEVNFQLVGDLTVRDITQQVTFDVTATVAGDTLAGVAETNMNISDFGIAPPNFAETLTVADPFTIRIEFVAKEQ